MDLRRLSGGSDVNAPTVSPSMATALLAYSGIGVKMLIDQQRGAQLHTMFVVDYQPTAIAHPHDHPFEEAYVFVEGEVHALVDGNPMVLHPGDVLWAGVGADHDSRIAGPGSSGDSKCKLLSHRRAIRIGSVESGSTLPRKWAVQILGKLEGCSRASWAATHRVKQQGRLQLEEGF